MSFEGIAVGVGTLLFFSLSRWSCIVGEYYFTKRVWIVFLIFGVSAVLVALEVENLVISSLLSVLGFCYLWGIGEVIAQEKRVERGWYPRNPKRQKKQKR